ncbi:MAG: aldehyde dehydrogenase [Thermotogota bacterium]
MISEKINKMKNYFDSNTTKDIDFRIEQLKKLKQIILENEEFLMTALKRDLNKSFFESFETEIGYTIKELSYIIKNLKKWSKPKKVKTSLINFYGKSYIHHEPFGVSLVISPWNYPFQLTISPIIGSIAAGNCTAVKVSEFSPNTSEALAKIINENFDENFLYVFQGEAEVAKELLENKFDYIFFTGSTEIGQKVMQAAAKNLTPVTLELGGKSPCIVDEDINLETAAKRLTWGKFINAGQTCIAPDYLFVHKNIKEQFIEKIIETINSFYNNDSKKSQYYPSIISEKHFDRLIKLMKEQTIIYGGEHDRKEKYIQPTLLETPDFESDVMQEEIFGPILPIFEYNNLEEVITFIKKRPKPLALYFFSKNKELQNKITDEISYGGGTFNDTIMHIGNLELPFGGVGDSGIGHYHGKYSFETFSNKKSILKKTFWPDLKLRYPPYKGLWLLKKIFK